MNSKSMKRSIAPDFIHFLGKDRKMSALCITEYNEAETMELIKEEGIVIGKLKSLVSLAKKGLLAEEIATKEADMSLDEYRKAVAGYSK